MPVRRGVATPDQAEVTAVRDGIAAWYAVEHRVFPWRGLTDPYAVLVSEVMLQQTQAARIAERFPRFIARFPTADALAAAPAAAVLAEWSGLGYNRRALALQRAAAQVVAEGWPCDVAGLAALPGVGPYTARAVASLAFGIAVGVVDTNVRRWLVRRFAVPDHPASLQALADALAARGRGPEVAAWTHASMEFGAGVCTARAPRCDGCPIADGCPSRGRAGIVAVPRQAPFAGSRRAQRGRLLRALSAAPGHRLPEALARAAVDGAPVEPTGWDTLLASLEGDGLIHRSAGQVVLGPAPDAGATKGSRGPTIGP